MNADSLPVGALIRNGVSDADASVTIVNVSTGLYRFSVLVPETYEEGDRVQVGIVAAVGGVADRDLVFADEVRAAETILLAEPYEPGETPVVVIPAAEDATQTTGYLYTRDGQGALQGNVRIEVQLLQPGGSDSYSREVIPVTSNGEGLLTVPLRKAAKYQGRRGKGPWVAFTTGTDGEYALPQILGRI